MRLFKKQDSQHWTEYYKEALARIRSGDLKGANELVHKSLGIDPVTLKFSNRKYKKKAEENPKIFVKADFLSLVCQGALARLEFEQEFEAKGEVNYEAFHETADWAELISNKIQRSNYIDLLLIKDINESIADNYLRDRPEDPKEKLGHFFKYFHKLLEHGSQKNTDAPKEFKENVRTDVASSEGIKNKEDEQTKRKIIAKLIYQLRQIIQKKFLLTAEEKKKILENTVEKNYSANCLNIIRSSQDEALKLGSDHIGTEHLLLALVRANSSGAYRILNNLEKGIAKKVEDTIKPNKGMISKAPLPLTKRAELVLKIANHEAKVRSSDTTRSQHLLLALINERDGFGGSLLLKLGITYEMVCNQLSNQQISNQMEGNIMMYEKEIRACTTGQEISDLLSAIWDQQDTDSDKHAHGTEFTKTLKQLINTGVIEIRGGSVMWMPWRGINVPVFPQGTSIKINND